jgi:hypothetical protein
MKAGRRPKLSWPGTDLVRISYSMLSAELSQLIVMKSIAENRKKTILGDHPALIVDSFL